ncbi:MAG TPA: hypothetical protein VFF73_19560 [Planctomycetota bacterium]|nr:hypothetical protein [Planctomycetota bacterium]
MRFALRDAGKEIDDMKNKKAPKPFGLEHLVDVPDAEAERVNGGFFVRGPIGRPPLPIRHPRGPILHTNYISVPSTAFPTGDHG